MSQKAVIIIPEIYGVNAHIKSQEKWYKDMGIDVFIVDFLETSFPYHKEKQAYEHFVNHIGFEVLLEQVKRLITVIRPSYKSLSVIGYSVGATVAYLSSLEAVDGVVCFYGSRIRDYLDINPKCPVLIFSPFKESSYDVSVVNLQLKEKEMVEVHVLDGLHGFCDENGKKYCQTSKEKTKKIIKAYLEVL